MTNSNQTVSIICVYNNREQLDDMLVKSLININIGGGGGGEKNCLLITLVIIIPLVPMLTTQN